MDAKVCAVVLTRNRLGMLQQGIGHLRQQTHKLSAIVVVNNGSEDGTRAWLDAQADITSIHQEDVGSGGGFATGINRAYADGFDWIWVFDDDCIADLDALAPLIEATGARPEGRVFNSVCVASDNPAHLTGGAVCVRTNPSISLHGEYVYSTDALRARADELGIIDSHGGQLFLGTLLHRSVIEIVGLPSRIYFMRGDEIDYSLRLMRAGYHIWLVPKSITHHPAAPTIFLNVLGKKLPCETMPAYFRYHAIRSGIINRRRHYPHFTLLPYIARRLAGVVITEVIVDRDKSWSCKADSFAAALHGVKDGFQVHELTTESDYRSKAILK